MALTASCAALAQSVPPLTPDGDEAREWAERELSDPVYAAAEPTLLDRIAQAIGDFFVGLFSADLSGGWGAGFAIVAAVVVTVLIVTALLIWGVPRARRRAAASVDSLFAKHDTRTAAQLRKDAAAHAAAGRWDTAVVVRFRALARALAERDLVEAAPGATVHAFARSAALAFPRHAGELEDAAAVFDDVRYLRRPGTADLYRRVAAVDDAVAAERPVLSRGPEVPA
ncbi:DUF4129 domain-containing protein [Microbacterium sp. BWT-B31]|uniref:DUF4129 domain-containing protein n=1 Tax=Microbacterium sp. BWT-B31 TaxID=3232072 RepID=UPI0035275002